MKELKIHIFLNIVQDDFEYVNKLTYGIISKINFANNIYNKINIDINYSFYISISNEYQQFYFFNENIPQKYFFPVCCREQLSFQALKYFYSKDRINYLQNNVIKLHYFEEFFNSMSYKENTIVRGSSIPSKVTSLLRLKNSIILTNSSTLYTLPHEISHILLNEIHNSNYITPSNNIFYSPASNKSMNIYTSSIDNPDPLINPICCINQKKCMQKNLKKLQQGVL